MSGSYGLDILFYINGNKKTALKGENAVSFIE